MFVAFSTACTSQQSLDDISDQPQFSIRASATPSQLSARASATPLPRILVQIDRINNKVDLACRKFVNEESHGTGNMFELHRAFKSAYDEMLTLYEQTGTASAYFSTVRSELNFISYGLQITQDHYNRVLNASRYYTLPNTGSNRAVPPRRPEIPRVEPPRPPRVEPPRPPRVQLPQAQLPDIDESVRQQTSPVQTRIDMVAYMNDLNELKILAVQFCTSQ